MSCTFTGPQSPIAKYLIKPQQLDDLIKSENSEMSGKEGELIKKMLTETQDILESDDFKQVLEASIEMGFSIILDVLLSCFVREGTKNSAEGGDEGAFLNPHEVSLPLGKLLPAFRQTLLDRSNSEENLALVRHLLCLDVLNCFSANIYEAFCEPQ